MIARRWQAVTIALCRERDLGRKLSRHEYDELASERNVGSGRSLERHALAAVEGKSLVPKKPTGRGRSILNEVHDFMIEQACQFNYHFSHSAMGEAAKKVLGVGSPSTIRRVLEAKNWRAVTQRIVPHLSPENQRSRVEFSKI